MKKGDDVLTKKAFVVGGELIEDEVEKFIRQKLNLPAEVKKLETAGTKKDAAEACEPKKEAITFKKPALRR